MYGSATVSITRGPGPFSYLWNNNDTTATISNLASGSYSVTVTGVGGCSANGNVTVGDSGLLSPSVAITSNPASICQGAAATFSATANYAGNQPVYQWFYNQTAVGSNTPGYILNNSRYGDSIYVLMISNAACLANDTARSNVIVLEPEVELQQLCMATADTGLQENLIIWQDANQYATDTFYLYRSDTSGSNYIQIGAVSRDSASLFYDSSSYPLDAAYRYKIALKDTYGNITPLSNYHQTVHLTYLGNGNLTWTPYEIENTASPVTGYALYRTVAGNNNWQLVNLYEPWQTSASDTSCPSCTSLLYMIVADLTGACNIDGTERNTVFSNKVESVPASIDDKSATANIRLLSNPVHSIAEVINLEGPSTLQLTNSMGQILQLIQTSAGQARFDMSRFAAGIYYINIMMGNGCRVLKVVKY